MSQNVVKTHKNTADCVKKSQQMEFNRQLSVDKDISTEQISSADLHTSCQDVPKVGRKI